MEADIYINSELKIRGSELEIATSRSGGPGGQHVQKTDSRVTIRWNILQSASIGEGVRQRLLEGLMSRLTTSGEIVIHVDSQRSQIRNRETARERLVLLVLRALHRDKPRRKTKPHPAAKARRIGNKKHVGALKQHRSTKFDASDGHS